jgi:hypothetical protein
MHDDNRPPPTRAQWVRLVVVSVSLIAWVAFLIWQALD